VASHELKAIFYAVERPCQVIRGNLSDIVVPEAELSCSILPPICLAREVMSFSPEPCSLDFRIPRRLSDTVKRASP